MWRYAINLLTDNFRRLKPHECLAVLSFGTLYNLEDKTCGARTLDRLVKWMNQCARRDWKSRKTYIGFSSLECGLKTIDDPVLEGGSLTFAIENEHDECFGTMHGVVRNKLEPHVAAAIDLIRHPPPRPPSK